MNKLASGAIVGTLGIALLLGGVGTFATWNAVASVDGKSVTSGVLTIAPATNPQAAVTNAAGATLADTYKIAPGDVITVTKVLTVQSTGTNLAATLTFDKTSIGGITAVEGTLGNKASFVFTAGGPNVTPITSTVAGENQYKISPTTTGTTDVTVTVTISLPSTATNESQGQTLQLSALKFNLTQNAS